MRDLNADLIFYLERSLRDRLGEILWNSLANSLSDSLRNRMLGRGDMELLPLENDLWDVRTGGVGLPTNLRYTVWNSLARKVEDNIKFSARATLFSSLWSSLINLRTSLEDDFNENIH
jgi:hypothetical protein